MLRYHGHNYTHHSVKRDFTYWRCSLYRRGCRAFISSRCVDGYLIVNKSKDEIIHMDHDKPSRQLPKQRINKLIK